MWSETVSSHSSRNFIDDESMDEESMAITALRQLSTPFGKSLASETIRSLPPLEESPLAIKRSANIDDDDANEYRPMLTNKQPVSHRNRVMLHAITICVLVTLFVVGCMALRMTVLPIFAMALQNTWVVLSGKEDGTRCSVWNHSPLQQARCYVISQGSHLVMTNLHEMYHDLHSMKSVTTWVAYVFTTCWALYIPCVYIVKRVLYAGGLKVIRFYGAVYNLLNNPMLPFDYIESAIRIDGY
jgi:hypothetical protein